MRGDPPSQEQRQRFMAYMGEAGAPAEARGQVMLALFAHAFVYLLLTARKRAGSVRWQFAYGGVGKLA
jgi:hypothetical protein